jgi:hypothetical protein
MPDMRYGSRSMSTTMRRLNAFSLATLVSNCILALATFLFEPTAVFYYLCVTINLVCLVVWLLRGERVEDFIALSNLFITIYILLPAPPNAAAHYVFWGAPEVYSRLSSDVPYLCAVFLSAASIPTLLGLSSPRAVSFVKFNLNWRALVWCMIGLSMFLIINFTLFFSNRIDIETAVADEGTWRPLTAILMIILPRAAACAVFLCLAAYVTKRLRERFAPFEGFFLLTCASICLLYFNPLSAPRQLTMACLLSAFYLVAWFGLLSRRWFALIVPVAALFVGPAISNITRYEITSSYFPVSADFDCFQNMNIGMAIISVDGLKWGGHMLASLSSILPSELKFFSDYHLMESPYFVGLLPTANISMPLPVELYADFGTFGLIAETLLIFWYLRSAVSDVDSGTNKAYLAGKVSILFGCWLALMRGPILGNSPVPVTFLLAWFIIYRLLDPQRRSWGKTVQPPRPTTF